MMIEPKSGALKNLFADLHIHSSLSPCASDEMVPVPVVDKLINLGIGVFSITDHNSGLNGQAFERVSRDKGLVFIPGIELQSSEEVHILGYFPEVRALERFNDAVVEPSLTKGMKNDPARFGHQKKVNTQGRLLKEVDDMLSMPLTLSATELVDAIHEHDGLAVAAHLDRGFSLISQLGFIPPDLKIDAVEIKDVSKIDKIRNDHIRDRVLNVLSSSDSHHLHNLEPAKMRIKLEKPSVKGVLQCIKGEGEGRVIVSGKKHMPGSRRTPDTGAGSSKDWKSLYR